MGAVTNLDPEDRIGEFCDFLFGDEDGFVYLPSKDPVSDRWFTDFLIWPANRKTVIQTIARLSKTREVYIAPALYNQPDIKLHDIKGASVIWADFDGNLPSIDELDEKGSPFPTVRVKSSIAGHEHWYWKLDKFSTDIKFIQDTNRALAYALGADPSGWDIEQVLRPVGSFNHKRDVVPVELIGNTHNSYTAENFEEVPVAELNYSESDFDPRIIPDIDSVLLKYAWTKSEQELLKAKSGKPKRSSMLTKLGYMCCEKGLNNSEVYAILAWVDERWGKFSKRANKKQCYIRLVDFVRQKRPYKEESSSEDTPNTPETFKYRIRGFMTHYNSAENLEWIIPGLLHNSASMWFVGKSGSLKTALAMELGINLALGKSILSWENNADRPLKLIMWSLEMGESEIKERQHVQVARHTSDELDQLEQNFLIYDDPDPLQLFDPFQASIFKEAVLEHKPDGLIIDSAQMSMSQDMSGEEQVKKSIRFLQELRHRHNFFTITIHHPRKDLAGVKAQKMTLSDLFGSQTMANSASTVIGMQLQDKKESEPQKIDLLHLKTRFSEIPADFTIQLNSEDFTFSRPVISLGGNNDFDMMKEMTEMADKMIPVQKPKKEAKSDPGLTF